MFPFNVDIHLEVFPHPHMNATGALFAIFSLLTLTGCVEIIPIQAQTQAAPSAPQASGNISRELRALLKDSKVPGVAAAVIQNGKISTGVAGIRKYKDPALIQPNDKFHLGSCAKSMTATLAAVLVEEGRLRWDSTLAEVFQDYEIHPGFRRATLTQLLSHNAGFPSTNFATPLWREIWASKSDGRTLRTKLAKARMREKPRFTPGQGYIYSNAGFAVAGAMLEKVTGQTWQNLMRSKIFRPLGMSTAGFRAPASKDTVDQPWGPAKPFPYGDLPDAIGPAGTIHCSIGDWAKYVQYHVSGNPRPLLKSAQTLERLHQVHNSKSNYGLGWNVSSDLRHGRILTHGGTNKMWYAKVWMAPNQHCAVVVACNAGTPEANALCAKTVALLSRGL